MDSGTTAVMISDSRWKALVKLAAKENDVELPSEPHKKRKDSIESMPASESDEEEVKSHKKKKHKKKHKKSE